MNKLPAKQIYLLSIIVFGIIALSAYSTYAIFTFEASTSNAFSIETPGSLSLSESITKYKLVTVPKNSVTTTDIDIYNNFDYSLCYSVWYKTLKDSDMNVIKVYEQNENTITTSGTIDAVTSKRVKVLLINDSDKDIQVKIGLSYAESSEACELNIPTDKKQITAALNPQNNLNTTVINSQVKNSEAGYLTYNLEKELPIDSTNFMVAVAFSYQDELFTIKEPKSIELKDINNYLNYYTCLASDNCKTLYHIKEVSQKEGKYYLTKYEMFVGYLKGESGVRKVNNNYYYYGDNPNNFVYYNCINELDSKTCELWRIIGLAYDEENNKYITKLIKDDYLTKTKYADNEEAWEDSKINNYLSKDYKLNNDLYLKEISFKQENLANINDNITFMDKQNKNKITIMNLSDYLNTSVCTDKKANEYTGECLTNNWLNKGDSEWTMTMNYLKEVKDAETEEVTPGITNKVYTIGNAIESKEVNTELNIRPVVYLKDRMLVIAGNGSFDNPYIIR